MQVNFNLLPQNSYAQKRTQKNQNQPSFGINVSKNFLRAAKQNLTGPCQDLGENFLAKVSEIKVYGNNTTVYDYAQKEGLHILSIMNCTTIGDKFFPKKVLQVERKENFLDLVNAFISRDKNRIKSDELLLTNKINNNVYNDLIDSAPEIIA